MTQSAHNTNGLGMGDIFIEESEANTLNAALAAFSGLDLQSFDENTLMKYAEILTRVVMHTATGYLQNSEGLSYEKLLNDILPNDFPRYFSAYVSCRNVVLSGFPVLPNEGSNAQIIKFLLMPNTDDIFINLVNRMEEVYMYWLSIQTKH